MTMCAILGCSIEAEADGFCTAHGRQVEGFIEAARCKPEGRPDESGFTEQPRSLLVITRVE